MNKLGQCTGRLFLLCVITSIARNAKKKGNTQHYNIKTKVRNNILVLVVISNADYSCICLLRVISQTCSLPRDISTGHRIIICFLDSISDRSASRLAVWSEIETNQKLDVMLFSTMSE